MIIIAVPPPGVQCRAESRLHSCRRLPYRPEMSAVPEGRGGAIRMEGPECPHSAAPEGTSGGEPSRPCWKGKRRVPSDAAEVRFPTVQSPRFRVSCTNWRIQGQFLTRECNERVYVGTSDSLGASDVNVNNARFFTQPMRGERSKTWSCDG